MPSATLRWFQRKVPAFGSLFGYRASDARADFVAGVTVAAVAVPQAMAYALVAGLPVQYGLYTAIVMTAIGALFDSSRQLINGPTNAISIAVLSAIAMVEPEQKIQAAVLLALLVGLVQLTITFLRLGDLARYISHSVIVGFTLGAGSLLVLDQVKNFLGMKAMGGVHDHFLVRFYLSMTQGGGINTPTAMIGIGSVLLVLGIRWIKKRFNLVLLPDLLIVVSVAAWVVVALGLEAQGVKVIGEIPSGLPGFEAPRFDLEHVRQFWSGALAIAVLGLLEAISMAKAIAAQTKQRLDVNQQCLSEGVANVAGSFFHCFPGSGSLTRSAINQQAGASTQWSGVWSAVAVALIMLVFAPFARFIPRASLAGILMVSAYKMVDWKSLAYHFRATRFDAVIVAATAFSAVAISVEFCVLIGTFMSFLLTVPRAGRMLLTEFTITDNGQIHERLSSDPPCDRIMIFGLEGELFFGASTALEEHFVTIEKQITAATEFIILRVKRTRNPDAVGIAHIAAFMERMEERGITVLLCGVRREFQQKFERTGLDERWRTNVFLEEPVRQTSTLLAIRHAYRHLKNPCDRCPRRDPDQREQLLYFAI